MALKEAIVKSLEDIGGLASYTDVYKHITSKKYFDFGGTKDPAGWVSAELGNFIRKGDTRIRRIKQNGSYSYYLTVNEYNIEANILTGTTGTTAIKTAARNKAYEERDLHKLLATYLNACGINSKTIFHERSSNSKDKNQKWTHPDMVGIAFLKLEASISQAFQKIVNRDDTFKLYSYEVKKEINTDYELKESFFQAVSNSSWANYGYLVVHYINDILHNEMKRLNQSFGIGVIELKSNSFESKVLFPAKYRELDFKTIDKLCMINKEFEKFIEYTEKVMTATDKYLNDAERGLKEFCDKCFITDSEMEEYCKEKNIQTNEDIIELAIEVEKGLLKMSL